ncbi:hypothetical protein MMC09_002898 [Bachmanniomyces sp. S44760]|nr:hypothetical protein [Bachmanniomyces sp. S44760]
MDNINIPELVERLGSDEDAVRKMAVFKLQSNIGDPSFADVFIAEGGLTKLRYLTLRATGNTLAYSLTSFSRLLEVDKGWEYVNQELVERVVELVVTHPLVNILRGAMAVLVAIVSHPHTSLSKASQPDAFGFRALKPAIAIYSQFLEMLVSRLSSPDHALCTNALQLINSLMRDAISSDSDLEWPKFIRKLQELGVIKVVYSMMQSAALQDLAHPLLEFQALTKVLLRKWRDIPVDLGNQDHRRALKSIHIASNPEKVSDNYEEDDGIRRRHNPEKWRRLGFESETPSWEFEEVGFLGMMDVADYVKKNEDGFQKLLLEQSAQPAEERCPIVRSSLAVTAILYEHFEIDKSDIEDAKGYLALESRANVDKIFKPLILQWSRLHTAGLQAFLRLWKATGAEGEDFTKIFELVRILLEAVVGGAIRTKDISEVEEELAEFDYQRLRELQMELFEMTYEDTWGQHLRQVRDELSLETLQFIKEQRIRCLLAGAWFPNHGYKSETGPITKEDLKRSTPLSYRYVRLSHNRRYLHYADFPIRGEIEPTLESLSERIDLSLVTSVASNISSTTPNSDTDTDTASSNSTLKGTLSHSTPKATLPSTTKITILGYLRDSTANSRGSNSHSANHNMNTNNNNKTHSRTSSRTHHSQQKEEHPLLTLHPPTPILASEWLDGLLMLLNQQPITSETNKLIRVVSDYGLKIRLLNVRFEGRGGYGVGLGVNGEIEMPKIPTREGLDEDYYYEMAGG